jgi:hypothetical protein
VREPEPLRAGGTLIFPDFLAQHRILRDRRILIEILGFWTPDYVTTKLARLRESGIRDIILCIDEDRACGAGELPEHWSVVRFRRRLDAAAVLREIERLTAGGGAPTDRQQ